MGPPRSPRHGLVSKRHSSLLLLRMKGCGQERRLRDRRTLWVRAPCRRDRFTRDPGGRERSRTARACLLLQCMKRSDVGI